MGGARRRQRSRVSADRDDVERQLESGLLACPACVVGGLGAEHHRLAGKRAGEPVECRCARIGGAPASPRFRQEDVAGLGIQGIRTDVTRTLCVAPAPGSRSLLITINPMTCATAASRESTAA